MHRLRRTLPLLAAVSAASAALPASAVAITPVTPPRAEIGAVRFTGTGAELLVPVRYPLHMKGRTAGVRLTLRVGGRTVGHARASARLAAGLARQPDRRERFRFVHRVALDRRTTAALREARRVWVGVRAPAVLDADGDGRADAVFDDVAFLTLRSPAAAERRRAAGRPLCSSVPVTRAAPGRATTVALPTCDRPVRWSIAGRPEHGRASASRTTFAYRPARTHRGRDELTLVARVRTGARAAGETVAPANAGARTAAVPSETVVPVQLVVGSAQSQQLVVRALGDSVTAGFGYFSDGTPMTLTQLPDCRPSDSGENDACSSNATNTSSDDGPVQYAADYGLSNDVAWPAQWANRYGITNFANYAISGSAPGDWAPGGQFHPITQKLEAADPDYVVLTAGANPLLSDVLFGTDEMGCAIYSDLFGGYTQCVQRWFAQVNLAGNLAALYRDLLARTDATILVMQYHLSIPASALLYSAAQIEQMADLTNGVIASTAASFGTPRLRVVAPPRFDVGIDMTPLAPNTYSCSELGYRVDGQSVQSSASQAELLLDHPLSFCSGPPVGDPWIISADTGIHPSAVGHSQMMGALPAP